ncbi:hypothetical protein QE152_g29063 [Popillia japonica]|uniref:Endonuclease/exonuclease/phosphatase domain-containing protein n=1 Tax=Popillia japonica TaxID=7064 RepID=A0AAW1JJ84_POPJA
MGDAASKFINIMHWNADGIQEKLDELATSVRRWGTRIILLNETRTSAKYKIRIRGFSTEHLWRNNYGGVAVLMREDVPYKRLPLRDPALQSTEAVAVQLQDDTIIIACYNSPRRKLTELELNALFGMGRKVALVGDLNATHPAWNKVALVGDLNATHPAWNCSRSNPNGNKPANSLT